MANRRPARGKERARKRRKARPQRSTLLLRWSLAAVALLVGFLYYQPVSRYFETRDAVNAREAEVAHLRAERARLARRLELSTSRAALMREARLMELVRPGERLFIVKGVDEWRRANAKKQAATLGDDG